MIELKKRLDKILPRITSDKFLNNSGLGKEIGFYIFDYPPEYEMDVRDHIDFILRQLPKIKPDLKFKHINLFKLIITYLNNRKFLDRVKKMQKEKGDQEVLSALKGILAAEKIAKTFIEEADPDHHDLIVISGVGSAYPLMRSHNLLNNLQSLIANKPLVMFFPGIYTGQGLRLFGKLKESNYYRAFQLVV
jgi:hypothetical protein